MLKIPQLDNLSYDKLFERARSRIPALNTAWTDFNHHDPGITTLQVYAWLVDTLNYYIDATGEEHRLKYLKLLNLIPEKAAARCILEISGTDDGEEMLIPRGTRIAAGDIVFEFEEACRGRANRMIHIFSELDGSFTDLTPFAGVDGGFAQLFTWDRKQDAAVYFGFAAPLEGTFRPWIEVAGDLPRNPFDKSFSLSEISWEYFDGYRWKPAELKDDETCGFLRSGFVSLFFDGETGKLENPVFPAGHYLRCRLIKNEYDVLPRIGRVVPCCATAVQQNTYVQALQYTYKSSANIPVDYYFRDGDHVLVAVEEQDGNMHLWYENDPDNKPLCELVHGELEWQREIRFSKRKFGRVPEKGSKVLLITASGEVWDNIFIGRTSGYAEARLPFDAENLYDMKLALVDPRSNAIRVWELCDDIRTASFDDAVFAYDSQTQEIVFGNGINGMQPESGQIVIAIEIKTSLMEGGHVRKGQVNRFLDQVQPGISALNLQDAAGGKTPKTSAELQELIEEKLSRVTRAVNTEDYRSLVMRTPGLIIDLVNVIPMKEYCKVYGLLPKPNTVLLAVKPYSAHEERPSLSENYRRMIRDNLERYRLLTTNIEVIAPRYAGIVVHGRVSLTENTYQNREEIFKMLREMIDFSATRRFGGRVIYGSVFSHLEMLSCVRRVEQISFEYVGDGARSNEQGDVLIHPDTLAYLRDTDIEFN